MKNLKKLVIASFMLVIAFVAVVSSTYAWFTQGTEAKIDNITIGVVDADKAMLVSKDNGVTWSKEISLNYNGKLTPSTVTGFENGVLEFSNLTLDGATPLTAILGLSEGMKPAAKPDGWDNLTAEQKAAAYENEPAAVTNYRAYLAETKAVGGFIAIDLQFQVTVNDVNTWGNTKINMDLTNLRALNVSDNTPNQRALSSFRMAVVQHGGTGFVDDLSEFVEDRSTTTLNEGLENELVIGTGRYGEGDQFKTSNHWMQVYAEDGIELVEPNANADYILAAAYDQSQTYYKDTKALSDVENVHEYVIECGTQKITVNANPIDDDFTRIFHITVYIWMEGWDGDNINAASGIQYMFNLNFKTE